MRTVLFALTAPVGLLAACGGPTSEVAATEQSAARARPARLVFTRGFGAVTPDVPLVGGARITVEYDRQRLYDIVDGRSSVGYFASTYHCYGYGCCEVRFTDAFVRYRFSEGPFETAPLDPQGQAQIVLPEDAEHLELYVDAPGYDLRTWYCGCDTACAQDNYARSGFGFHSYAVYDSQFGDNYHFEVTPTPTAPPVRRLADGQWASDYAAPSGARYGWFWDANVWVDVALAPKGTSREIGVRWTVDGWQTWTDSPARFEGILPGGEEQWGVDVTPAERMRSCYWCAPTPVTFEYAIFATVDGETTWDNNGGEDYSIELATEYE